MASLKTMTGEEIELATKLDAVIWASGMSITNAIGVMDVVAGQFRVRVLKNTFTAEQKEKLQQLHSFSAKVDQQLIAIERQAQETLAKIRGEERAGV